MSAAPGLEHHLDRAVLLLLEVLVGVGRLLERHAVGGEGRRRPAGRRRRAAA